MAARDANRVNVKITPIGEEEARAIVAWRYDAPYSFYNSAPEDLDNLLRPEYAYHSVRTEQGELIGFACFGPDARVRGGDYDDDESVLDIGGGLRPDLTGKGLGLDLLESVLEFARGEFPARAFRTTIASFNQRAIRVCQKAGFVQEETFGSQREAGEVEFVVMTTPRP